jgi:MFS family permease
MVFINPFKKHDVSEFEGVLVSLEDAHRYPSVITAHDTKLGTKDGKVVDPSAVEADGSNLEQYSAYTIEALRAEIDSDIAASAHDTVYDRKSKVINKAIQDIGMGKYQWQLFVLCGFGWLADNLWLQGLALTLPSLTSEFGVSSTQVRYTTCATFVGLCIGASFWGVASDVIGRRLAFNATLFIAGVFGLAIGGANTWVGVCGLFAALGVGVGGNLPVDGALFLEFLPFASGNLLTMLSVWWPVGQLIASLIAWGFIPNYSCDPNLKSCYITEPGVPCCRSEDNRGWRYLTYTMGAITFSMFIARFFFFHLYESPKYLLSRGRQAEAVATVHAIAAKNGRQTWLTEEILNEIGGVSDVEVHVKLSIGDILKRQISDFSAGRVAPLFHTRRLGVMTVLIWFCWTTIGIGFPLFASFLPLYLQGAGKGLPLTPTNIVYRNYAITSIIGVPGSVIACYTVDMKYIGRKGTIAISTLFTGIFLFLFTLSNNSDYQVSMSSLEAFFQNIMYGVLYA